MAHENLNENEVTITRTFDAPREQVWKAWTDPDMFTQWFGPKTYTTPTAKIDLREGGSYLYCMRSPDGKDTWATGTYREIVEMERIVMTDSFADEKGNIVPGSHYGMSPDFPREMLITVTFEDEGEGTRMTLTHSGITGMSDADQKGMAQGWSESFDKLAETLR